MAGAAHTDRYRTFRKGSTAGAGGRRSYLTMVPQKTQGRLGKPMPVMGGDLRPRERAVLLVIFPVLNYTGVWTPSESRRFFLARRETMGSHITAESAQKIRRTPAGRRGDIRNIA